MWFQSNQPIGEKHSDGPANSNIHCDGWVFLSP